jgi:hypothetical protein
LLRGSSTTTLDAATAHSADSHRRADCHQPDGRVHLDSIEGRYTSKENQPGDKPQTPNQRKISSELRAFGQEAAAALKLAIGASYDSSRGKLSQILSSVPSERLSPERNKLALEFHILDSVSRNKPVLAAFVENPTELMQIAIKSSLLLERVGGYLATYKEFSYTPTTLDALQWLNKYPEVVEKGPLEGVRLFSAHRPQART